MIHETINLKEYYPSLKNDAYLTTYCPENSIEWKINEKRKGLLILPGGGYEFVSEREAEPVALRFVGQNIACFTLKYSVAPSMNYPDPIMEAFAALSYIRRNADKYHINVDKISVLGFSAGGHLAATISCYHTSKEYSEYLNIPQEEMKINGCLLGYPVITMDDFTHAGTRDNITKGDKELLKKMSIEKNITNEFPKTFIWHTTFDTCVPVKNALVLANALTENKVFYELHIYPMHDHGQSLSDESVYSNVDQKFLDEIKYNTQWVDNAIHFIKEYI